MALSMHGQAATPASAASEQQPLAEAGGAGGEAKKGLYIFYPLRHNPHRATRHVAELSDDTALRYGASRGRGPWEGYG
jgi:hypothetical protein